MSVQNLASGQINSVDIPCTVSGAITGSVSINLKRLNNIVYLSFGLISGTAAALPSIILTPDIPVPVQFRPLAGIWRNVSVGTSTAAAAGILTCPNTLSPLTFTLVAGGNFATVAGTTDNTIMWNAVN